MLPVKLPDVLAKKTSTFDTVDLCILLFKVISMILATYTHGRDFDELLTLKEFDTVAKKMAKSNQ